MQILVSTVTQKNPMLNHKCIEFINKQQENIFKNTQGIYEIWRRNTDEILNAVRQFIVRYQVLIPLRMQCYEKLTRAGRTLNMLYVTLHKTEL
jgi:hypothetical protein